MQVVNWHYDSICWVCESHSYCHKRRSLSYKTCMYDCAYISSNIDLVAEDVASACGILNMKAYSYYYAGISDSILTSKKMTSINVSQELNKAHSCTFSFQYYEIFSCLDCVYHSKVCSVIWLQAGMHSSYVNLQVDQWLIGSSVWLQLYNRLLTCWSVAQI